MARIVWRAAALDDLDHLRAYIARDNPRAAEAIRDRIVDPVSALATYPAVGRPGRVSDTRELVIAGTPYIVPYRLSQPDTIEILAVIHGARRWPDILPSS